MLNLTVQASVNQTECLINQKHKLARQNRKDQPWRRLATLNKIAQKAGYNLPNYSEKRTIAELLNQYGEYSYLTGKRLGIYYLSTLDLDIWKEEFHFKRVNRLVKNLARLVDYLKVSYDKTKKGLHVDILTPEPLNNGIIYWTDKLGKKWNIGSIQSKGKYVVGEDPNKFFIQNGKWYWKVLSNGEVKSTLNKFFFEFKETEQKTTQKPTEAPSLFIIKNPQQPALFNSLITPSKKYTTIQAKILSIQKTNLENIWKIFYLDNQQHRGHFLLNQYHRKKVNLTIGISRNILLVNGKKHDFFSRLL